tara:strand:- start:3388 stop:3813 length:426 start_codon:yes stop_codon:yes gene_type:complete
MVAFNGIDPRNITLKNAETFSGLGVIITNDGTTNTAKIHPGGAVVPIGITAGESSRDADQAYETTGATVSFLPLVGVQMVQAKAAQTFTYGLPVWAGAAGQLLDSQDATDKKIGIYVGEGIVTGSANGELVPVLLSGVALA